MMRRQGQRDTKEQRAGPPSATIVISQTGRWTLKGEAASPFSTLYLIVSGAGSFPRSTLQRSTRKPPVFPVVVSCNSLGVGGTSRLFVTQRRVNFLCPVCAPIYSPGNREHYWSGASRRKDSRSYISSA